MRAIQIQFDFELFGVKFTNGLFLTDADVLNIIHGKPDKYQGYFTIISRVSECHTRKLLKLADKYNIRHNFKIYDI